MNKFIYLILFFLTACQSNPDINTALSAVQTVMSDTSSTAKNGSSIKQSQLQQEPMHLNCTIANQSPLRAYKNYTDYYGTILTTDRNLLKTPERSFDWGMANKEVLQMAYFAGYFKNGGKYRRFNAFLYADPNVRAPLTFELRAEKYDGIVLKSVRLEPGNVLEVDVDVTGVTKLYVGTELNIGHDKAQRLIVGNPRFYNCK